MSIMLLSSGEIWAYTNTYTVGVQVISCIQVINQWWFVNNEIC